MLTKFFKYASLVITLLFSTIVIDNVYAAAAASAVGSFEASASSKAVTPTNFIEYEKIRYNNTTLTIRTKGGEIVVPDHFESLLMSAGRAKGVIWTLGKVIGKEQLGGKNIATAHIILVFDDKQIRVPMSSAQELHFLSGSLKGLTRGLRESMGVISLDLNPAIEENKFHCFDSIKRDEREKRIKTFVKKHSEFFSSSLVSRKGGSWSAGINFLSLFGHSEQAAFAYIEEEIEELIRPIIEENGKRPLFLVLDLVSDRDMCDNCFKTLFLKSLEGLNGFKLFTRVIGTRAHETGSYHSRDDDKRAKIGKLPLEIFEQPTHIDLSEEGPKLFVRNIDY